MNIVSSSAQGLTINVTIGNYDKRPVVINGTTYYSITNKQGTPILKKGFPDLPKVTKSIAIPNFSGVTASVVNAEYIDYSIQIVPSKGILMRTVNPGSIPYEFGTVYNENNFFPQVRYDFGEPYLLHTKRGIVINVYPFAYNPVQRILRVYTSLKINISFSGSNTKNSLSKPEIGNKFFDAIYKNHFINFSNSNNRQDYGNEKMLIICYDDFLDKMRPFVTHKNNIGLETEMVALSSVGNTPAAIKQFIQNRYNADNQLTFVLLVGDHAQIPSFTLLGGGSDPSYSLLEGNDNYPDIIIGRFSAENTGQVETMVNRTVFYETLPHQQSAWFKRGIGIASNIGSGIGDDGQSDYEHLRQIRTDLLNWNYTSVAELYDGSQGGLDASGEPTIAMVASAVNNGASLINYTGHGSTTSWLTSNFSNSNVTSLANVHKLPFIFSVACINGNFTNTTCFAESWLRATNNQLPTGAIGFYGSSINQDWQPPMEAQDKFNELLVNEDFTTFGELCFNGSCSMIDKYGQNGINTFLTWNYFGDPSVSYVDSPEINLSISGSESISCNESSFSLSPNLSGVTYNWTVSSNIQIVSGQNTSTVKVKGKSYNSNSWIQLAITYDGKTYTVRKNVTVKIPNSFVLSAGTFSAANNGTRNVEITALSLPGDSKSSNYSYKWSATGGTIIAGLKQAAVGDSFTIRTVPFTSLIQELMDSNTAQLQQAVADSIDGNILQVREVASAVSNLSTSKSRVFELSSTPSEGETATEYVAVESGSAQNNYYSDIYYRFVDSYDSALLTFTPGITATVTCQITGCDKSYSATLVIPGYAYTSSYVPSNRSVLFVKDQNITTGGGVQTYQVQVYNDSGLVKTATFTSSQTSVSVSLSNLPAGNYYINVLDAQGNVVDRKTITAY
ncbi:MAG: C25 family cysteine peptidase [Dysgonamonadaceae bacterium]|nr:C25 family cysteine peptidase [Dysgonamonadaceae bacterium]